MAYTPNPTDVSQPVDSVFASTAAAEFRALKAYLATVVAGGGPGAQTPGMIADFPFTTAPPGWLACDGSLVSRATYAALWAIVGTNGILVADAVWSSGANQGSFSDGDGSTTFRLPDFRSMVRKGGDAGRGFGSQVAGKYQSPVVAHYHQTSMGFDSAIAYLWRDGSNNPAYGSDVVGGASRYTVAHTDPGSGSVRVARTAGASLTTTDAVIPANNGVLTCIKT